MKAIWNQNQVASGSGDRFQIEPSFDRMSSIQQQDPFNAAASFYMEGGLRLPSLKEDQHEQKSKDNEVNISQELDLNDRSTTSDQNPE